MVVAALAAYKHDTLGRYLPTVLHFRLQATLFLHNFWVSNAIRLSLSTLKIIDLSNYSNILILRKLLLSLWLTNSYT